MTNEAADHMAGTFAFYHGQLAAVDELSSRFPDLGGRFRQAQAVFDVRFVSAVRNIDAILSAEMSAWSAGGRDAILSSLSDRLDFSETTQPDAEAAVSEIERRAEGDVPSPYLETLLVYDPRFIAQPAEEMVRGYRETFRTQDHPKSKGVDFQIEIPTSWSVSDGRRPNVIAVFESENGRGLESALLMVKELPVDPVELQGVTGADLIGEGFAEAGGGTLLGATPIRLDGLEGWRAAYELEERAMDRVIRLRTVNYTVLFQNYFVMVQCMVGEDPESSSDMEGRIERFIPLFELIAASLVVQSRWE
ncbi:MAG: hypothetical protein CMM84_19590 [Rhodothermaceae bacterium]|nr:hypothetical protein [Rhodothermaceae bacterium]MBC12428.1 hypothetical protein [Rhodothermaceae bacterium]